MVSFHLLILNKRKETELTKRFAELNLPEVYSFVDILFTSN